LSERHLFIKIVVLEVPQETPCVAILNKKKMSLFFFYKIREQEGGTGPVWGIGTSGREEEVGKGCECGANTVYTCM
jgi:hypothetical protein